MAIKRKDIRDILNNEALDAEAKAKSILDLIHSDMDELRDRNDELQSKLDKAEKDLTEASNAKDKAVKDLEDYKTAQSTKDTLTAKQEAYKALLKAEKVSDKRIATIIKATDFSAMELDKDGKLKDEKKLSDSIKSEWADFIEASGTQGAGVQNPPNNGGKAKTKEEIMAIKDTHERQQAMIENHELFGI